MSVGLLALALAACVEPVPLEPEEEALPTEVAALWAGEVGSGNTVTLETVLVTSPQTLVMITS